jgi:hypothetical protein
LTMGKNIPKLLLHISQAYKDEFDPIYTNAALLQQVAPCSCFTHHRWAPLTNHLPSVALNRCSPVGVSGCFPEFPGNFRSLRMFIRSLRMFFRSVRVREVRSIRVQSRSICVL